MLYGPGPVASHQNVSGVSLPDIPTDIIRYCIHGPGFIFTRPTICYHWPFNTKVFFGGLGHHGSVENNETLNIPPLSPLTGTFTHSHFLPCNVNERIRCCFPRSIRNFLSKLYTHQASGSEQVYISL